MDKLWLPKGTHWGLTIDHKAQEDAGAFTGGGNKVVLHTTEGANFGAMSDVLIGKRAVPHFLIDPTTGHVRQFVALNHASRALEHPGGTPETNRANAIQIEMCGFAKDTPRWPVSYYAHIAALCVLIDHRRDIPKRAPAGFGTNPFRLSGQGFVRATGYLGHEHVPNNTHWDPGAFNISLLFKQMTLAEQHHA